VFYSDLCLVGTVVELSTVTQHSHNPNNSNKNKRKKSVKGYLERAAWGTVRDVAKKRGSVARG